MSKEQPGSSLGQTTKLSLHPKQMLRKGLGSVLSDPAVMVALCGSLDAGYVCPCKHGGPPASTCQPSTFISTPAPHLCRGSWPVVCFLLLGDFGVFPPPRLWGHVPLPSPF